MAILSNWDTTNYMDESGPPEDEYYGPIYCPLCGAHHNEWEEGDAAPGDLRAHFRRHLEQILALERHRPLAAQTGKRKS